MTLLRAEQQKGQVIFTYPNVLFALPGDPAMPKSSSRLALVQHDHEPTGAPRSVVLMNGALVGGARQRAFGVTHQFQRIRIAAFDCQARLLDGGAGAAAINSVARRARSILTGTLFG